MSTTELINQVRNAPSHKLAHELICAKRILIARGSSEAAVKRLVDFVFGLRTKDRVQASRMS